MCFVGGFDDGLRFVLNDFYGDCVVEKDVFCVVYGGYVVFVDYFCELIVCVE